VVDTNADADAAPGAEYPGVAATDPAGCDGMSGVSATGRPHGSTEAGVGDSFHGGSGAVAADAVNREVPAGSIAAG